MPLLTLLEVDLEEESHDVCELSFSSSACATTSTFLLLSFGSHQWHSSIERHIASLGRQTRVLSNWLGRLYQYQRCHISG